MAKGDAIPNCGQTWKGIATCPLHLGPSHCRTQDGWVHDKQSWPDVWTGLPFAPLVPASLQYCDGMPATVRLGPTSPGIEHVGCGRGVELALAPQGELSGASPPCALVPSVPYIVALPVSPSGSVFTKAYAPGGRLFLSPCTYSAPVLP